MLVSCMDTPTAGRVDCLLIDVRTDPQAALESAAQWQTIVPLIALADTEQAFSPDYPFGCYLQDHVTTSELGTSLFWYKLEKAKRAYSEPLQLGEICSPAYALLQEIVNYSSDWILVKDLQHRFMLASENFANSAGYDINTLLGKDDLEIGNSPQHVFGDPDNDWQGFWPQDDAVTNSGNVSIEENPHWDLYSRSERYRRTIRAPLRNAEGKIYSLLVCSQDITEHKKNEALLRERTAMLAQVTEEKRSAEANRLRAEEAVAAKTKFLAAASHDLRQPLHAMGLFLDILHSRSDGKPEQQLVNQIQQSCATLRNLFNGCLDISRLDAGVVERSDEDFRVRTFLEGLNTELTQQAYVKGLRYSYIADNAVVRSDSMLLGRIFRNLVNNAIQNTEHGHIKVVCQLRDDRVELSVSDTGKGIPEEEKIRIFSEFHQVDSTDARMGRGLGLGLAIVKRLCELLEIEIELDSTIDKGSTFTLRIPQGLASNIVLEEEPEQHLALEGMQVLIIDDDKYIRHGMEALLQACGCNTVSAADHLLALSALRRENMTPSIIVADYHLSNGNTGTSAIHEIRREYDCEIPAVLVTGDTTSDSEQEAARHALRILYKPVSSELLLATISNELMQINQKVS